MFFFSKRIGTRLVLAALLLAAIFLSCAQAAENNEKIAEEITRTSRGHRRRDGGRHDGKSKRNVTFGIILAAYERENDPYFRLPCANSFYGIAQQAYKDWYLILSGDGISSQGVGRIFQALRAAGVPDEKVVFRNMDPARRERFLYDNSNNEHWLFSGVNALNMALEIAYDLSLVTHIARLDEDDVWLPSHLQNLADVYLQNPDVGFSYTQSLGYSNPFNNDNTDYGFPHPENELHAFRPPVPCGLIHSTTSWTTDFRIFYRQLEEQHQQRRNRSLDTCCERPCNAVLPADADMWERIHGLVQRGVLASVFVSRADVVYMTGPTKENFLEVLLKNKTDTSNLGFMRERDDLSVAISACQALVLDYGNNPDWRPARRTESSMSRQESRNSLALLRDLAGNCDGNTPVITFALNKHGVSGGFGDRLRGMVTTYYLAVMTNSSFAVGWTQPYNLTDFFTVPSCNAHERSRSLDQSPSIKGAAVGSLASASLPGTGAIVRTAIDDWKYFSDFSFVEDAGKTVEIHTNAFHWKEVVRHPAFRGRAASLDLLSLSQVGLFKLAIDVLISNPTNAVREAFDSVKQRLAAGIHEKEPPNADVPYVGVQIRLGGRNSGAVSGWDDPARHSLEDVDCFAAEAVRLCHKMHIKRIFVTADSEDAVRKFEGAVSEESAKDCSSCPPPIVIQVPGSIGHTDRSTVPSEHARDVWLKSILDWWTLKHAAALVISRSGFGETAALSSDADLALRLKLSTDVAGTASNAGGKSGRCEFEDILEYDKEIYYRRS